jgi:hypothetical protein
LPVISASCQWNLSVASDQCQLSAAIFQLPGISASGQWQSPTDEPPQRWNSSICWLADTHH